jgi:hypothetical protein
MRYAARAFVATNSTPTVVQIKNDPVMRKDSSQIILKTKEIPNEAKIIHQNGYRS